MGWPYTGAQPFQRAFLLEIQSFYSIFYIETHSTHWWLIFEMMVHFEKQLLQRLHVLRHNPLVGDGLWFILEYSHFRWFILGHSYFIHIHIARGFWFIWIMLRYFHFWQWELRLIDLLTYTRHDPSVVVDSNILRHSRDGEYFSLEHSRTIGSFTLGHIHLLEGDQIDSWRWSIWQVIWRSLDYFMLSSLYTGE